MMAIYKQVTRIRSRSRSKSEATGPGGGSSTSPSTSPIGDAGRNRASTITTAASPPAGGNPDSPQGTGGSPPRFLDQIFTPTSRARKSAEKGVEPAEPPRGEVAPVSTNSASSIGDWFGKVLAPLSPKSRRISGAT